MLFGRGWLLANRRGDTSQTGWIERLWLELSRILWVLLTVPLLSFAIIACGSEFSPAEPTLKSISTSEATAVPTASPTPMPVEPTVTPAPTATAEPAHTLLPTATTPALASTIAAPTPDPTATTPPPTSVPTYAPQTGSPPWPLVGVPAEHPAAALAVMPDSTMYAYIDLETVSGRPALQEHVDFQLGHFVSPDELPFAEELLASIGADSLIFSSPFQRFDWAILLQGDFTVLAEALRVSAESSGGLSVGVIDTRREIDIYTLVRTKSSGYQSEIHLAVLGQGALTASPDLDAVRDVIDRHLDGGQLPEGLAAMVEDWGLGDFMEAFPVEDGGDPDSPADSATIFAFHADLADESNTNLRALRQFESEEQAVAAAAWLNEQTESYYFDIGWGASANIDQWRQRGATVYGEAEVPDADVPALVQGN